MDTFRNADHDEAMSDQTMATRVLATHKMFANNEVLHVPCNLDIEVRDLRSARCGNRVPYLAGAAITGGLDRGPHGDDVRTAGGRLRLLRGRALRSGYPYRWFGGVHHCRRARRLRNDAGMTLNTSLISQQPVWSRPCCAKVCVALRAQSTVEETGGIS